MNNEIARREFISAVLLSAVLLVPGTKLDVETSVIGEENQGRVAYSVLKGNELMCISEAE